jgi:aspartate dehydrogenase
MGFQLNKSGCKKMRNKIEKIVIIGYGAIGRFVCTELQKHAEHAQICMVLDHADHSQNASDGLRFTTDLGTALESRPTLAVECAGHGALAMYGAAILEAGSDLLVASVGALTDPELQLALTQAAEKSGASILIPSGALGGLDMLAAAKTIGIDAVQLTSTKPVNAWRKTAAESLIDLDNVQSPTEFFTGNVRGVAKLFPQNTNVAAAVAFAGIGYDQTLVKLIVDPRATGNTHQIRAEGAFGTFNVTVQACVLATNPKSSMLAPMSLVKAIYSRGATMRLA